MRVGSLFSGIGGIDLAFKQVGCKISWANEIDKDSCKTYRFNFPEISLLEKDIRDIELSELSKVDVITAGFPCQPFSVCGNQKGFSDERGNLFFEIMRISDLLVPEVIFLENVANLTDHDNGKSFNLIHNELAWRGYSIRYLVADAVDYGIAQHRTRVYIIAFKSQECCDNFKFPDKVNENKRIFDVIDKTKRVEKFYYLSADSKQYEILCKYMNDSKQIYRFSDYGIQAGKSGFSFTLKANMGTWKNRIPYIRDDFGIRMITPNECLALQGFPDSFNFPEIPLSSAYKQAGNSVAVPVVKKLAERIKEALLV